MMRWLREKWRHTDFDHVLVISLLIIGVCLFLLHLAYERPARRTATLAVKLLKQAQQEDKPGIDERLKGAGGEIALETAIINALATETRYGALSEGVLHLGFACLVSAAVIIMVESVSKRKFRREVKKSQDEIALNVWKAIFERYVPGKIVDEIRSLLAANVVKESCRYTITLLPPYDGMPDDTLVVRRDLAYDIHNISTEIVRHPLTAITTRNFVLTATDQDGETVSLPRHIKLLVDGVTKGTDSKELVEPIALQEDRFILELEPDSRRSIEVSGEEPYKIEGGQAGYSQLTQVLGLTVTVVNQYPTRIEAVGVRFNHPHWDQLKEAPHGTFSYPGGVLPGQGFMVTWRAKGPGKSKGSRTAPL